MAGAGELQVYRSGDRPVELWVGDFCSVGRGGDFTAVLPVTRALRLVERPRRVLLGGLGLGFTVEELLATPGVEHCTVVEIEPALVGWLRDDTIPGGSELPADDRVDLRIGDLTDVLGDLPAASYDLAIIDVDTAEPSVPYQDRRGLRSLREVLAPGGVLVIWSRYHDPMLPEALQKQFDNGGIQEVDSVVGDPYWMYVATLPD